MKNLLSRLPLLTIIVVIFSILSAHAQGNDPLSSMVAVSMQDDLGTGTTDIPSYVKALVAQYNDGSLNYSVPLANASTDTVRALEGLQHNIVISWLELSLTSTYIAPNAEALGMPNTTIGQALQDVNWNGIGGFESDNMVHMALFTAANKIGVMETNRPEDAEWNPSDISGTLRLYVAFTDHTRQTALNQDGILYDPSTHAEQSMAIA